MYINLYLLSGTHFKEIFYIDINNLIEILNNLLEDYNSYQFIQLILNNIIINEGNEKNNFNYYKVNNLNIHDISDNNIIQVIFISKNSLFLSRNDKNNLILDKKYSYDNYFKLLKHAIINIKDYDNIIMNNSYKNLVLKIVENYSVMLIFASISMKNDYDIIIAASNKDSGGLEFASDNMKNNKELILKLVTKNPNSLYYASIFMKNDKEIALTAVKQYGYALSYISEELRNDKDVVLSAVKQDGLVLRIVNSLFKNDKEIVISAVNNNGLALLYADNNLKNNKDIVLTAVKQNHLAFQYASDHLKNDKDILLINK